jgi:hypothetical protein
LFTIDDGAATDDLLVRGVLQNGSFQKLGTGTMRLTGSSANTATNVLKLKMLSRFQQDDLL